MPKLTGKKLSVFRTDGPALIIEKLRFKKKNVYPVKTFAKIPIYVISMVNVDYTAIIKKWSLLT